MSKQQLSKPKMNDLETGSGEMNNRKLKIGMFSDSYKPYISGVVKSIELFTRDLRSAGHEAVIIAPDYPGVAKESGIIRYPSIPAVTNRDFRLAIPLSRRAAREIRNSNFDIIHVHSPFLLSRTGARWAKRLGVPLVFTFHTLYTEYVHYFPIFPKLVRRITRWYLQRFCNGCDLIISPSEGVKKMIKSYGVTTPIVVIATGVEPLADPRQSAARKGFGGGSGVGGDAGGNAGGTINNDSSATGNAAAGSSCATGSSGPTGTSSTTTSCEKILLFVGRLGKEKNIPFLLEAMRHLLENGQNVRLVIVAGGPEEENLKKMAAELGVASAITFAGRKPFDQVVQAYREADLFVFASMTETQGLVILEAMSTGLPVVAVRATGVEDVVEDGRNGFLTSADTVEFARAIQKVLSNEELYRTMSANALHTASEYSSEKQAQKLVRAYEQVLGTSMKTS